LGFIDVVKLLVANGADANAESYNGKTALMIAKSKGRAEIVNLLRLP
jgi:ankyrin repeat protein